MKRNQSISQKAAARTSNHDKKSSPSIDQNRYAVSLCLKGIRYFHQHAYLQALVCLNRGLNNWQETTGNLLAEAVAMGYLGQIYAKQHKFWFALACYKAALSLCRPRNSATSRKFQAKLHEWLAELCQNCGHDDLAHSHLSTATHLRQGIKLAELN